MRRKDDDPIYSEALAVFGIQNQVSKAIEELAELQVALSHYLCGRNGAEIRICQEIADVEIMCEQMRARFDTAGLTDQHKGIKLDRLRAMVEHRRSRIPDVSVMTECSK